MAHVQRIKITVALILTLVLTLTCSYATVIKAETNLHEELERDTARTEAIERMRIGFENFEESIDISDLSILPDELGKLFSDAIKDTPYLVYVSNNLAYSYRAGGCVVAVKPRYSMDRAEAKAVVEYCKEEIRKMAELLCDRESDIERLVGAHDLICAYFSYDLSLESKNIYTFLQTGKGTCQGYTWTYMALLRELDIECRYVASDTINHIWLTVKIDGEWYNSDVTWDDPPSAEESGIYSRAHLLFSDEKADGDGYNDRYGAGNIECKSKLYDGEEFLSQIPLCVHIGDADHDGAITLRDVLLLRRSISNGVNMSTEICRLCANADLDRCIGEGDVEQIRRLLLEQLSRDN